VEHVAEKAYNGSRYISIRESPMKSNSDVAQARKKLVTFTDKYNHFEKVKMNNFKESMRLEGYDFQVDHIPADAAALDLLKQQLVKKYSQYGLKKSA
jgi:hypothetical protein